MKIYKTVILSFLLLFIIPIMLFAQGGVKLKAKVYLSSCYSNVTMTTNLLTKGFIPRSQPFNTSQWNYSGTETAASIPANIVDWVLIELRSSETVLVSQRAAFLDKNGYTVDMDGVSPVSFSDVPAGSYYIVIKHRNHIGVMSAVKVALSSVETAYNFTDSQSKAYGSQSMVVLPDGKFGMYAGDADGNGIINDSDYNPIENKIFKSGYLPEDLDMNGFVSILDYVQTSQDLNKQTNVPANVVDKTPPSLPTNISAVLTNLNTNPNLPVTISPYANNTQNYWGSNWNADWIVHALKNRAVVVDNPKYDEINNSPSCLRMKIGKNDNYTGFINSLPRAELKSNYNFNYRKIYKCSFKNFIPEYFKFDTVISDLNSMILFQLKMEAVDAPTRAVRMDGSNYYVENYIKLPSSAGGSIYTYTKFGSAANDLGKWVKWDFEFRVDSISNSSENNGYFKVYKNGILVYSDTKRTKGYTSDSDMKMQSGLYRHQYVTSIQDSAVMYRDDYIFSNLTDGTATLITDFGSQSGISGNNLTHYIDLSWKNPPDTDLDSTYIYSSLTNNNSTATKIASVNKSTTSYRYTLGTETIRYFWIKEKDKSGNLSSFSSTVFDASTVYAR